MTLEEMQFGALMLTSVLTIDLASRSLRLAGRVYNLSRWLMVTGIGLIAVQFLLQYTLHIRQMGVTQGVAVNLVFFMLASWLVSLAVLNLQRRGHLKPHERYFGLGCWAVAVAILGCGTLADGGPLLTDSPTMRTAEYGAAIVFALMQTYHTWLHWHEFRNIRHALNQYYDGEEKLRLLGWMERSVYMLCGIAVLLPFVIFLSGTVLFFYSLFLLGFIYYSVSRFINYGADNALQRVEAAEQSLEQTVGETLADGFEAQTNGDHQSDGEEDELTRQAIDRWTAGEHYCRQRLNIQEVATEMGIARELLSAWLSRRHIDYAGWLNSLRIEKAKELLTANPEWSNEAVARECGFTDRSYFQRKFKELTGRTPAEWRA